MKIPMHRLRTIIQEELHRLDEAPWSVWKTKRGQRLGNPIRVDANTTDEAGKLAAKQFNDGTDPYTLDIEKAEDIKSDFNYETVQQIAKDSVVNAIRILSILISNLTNPQSLITDVIAAEHLEMASEELNAAAGLVDARSQGPVFTSLMAKVGDVMGSLNDLRNDIRFSGNANGLEIALEAVINDLRKIRDALI